MRIARGLHVDDLEGGAVRVRARDWPWAWWVGVPSLAAGLPLVVWAAATRHWVELGGGAVFCAFGAFCGWLASTRRRDLEIRGSERGVSVCGTQGILTFRRELAVE